MEQYHYYEEIPLLGKDYIALNIEALQNEQNSKRVEPNSSINAHWDFLPRELKQLIITYVPKYTPEWFYLVYLYGIPYSDKTIIAQDIENYLIDKSATYDEFQEHLNKLVAFKTNRQKNTHESIKTIIHEQIIKRHNNFIELINLYDYQTLREEFQICAGEINDLVNSHESTRPFFAQYLKLKKCCFANCAKWEIRQELSLDFLHRLAPYLTAQTAPDTKKLCVLFKKKFLDADYFHKRAKANQRFVCDKDLLLTLSTLVYTIPTCLGAWVNSEIIAYSSLVAQFLHGIAAQTYLYKSNTTETVTNIKKECKDWKMIMKMIADKCQNAYELKTQENV